MSWPGTDRAERPGAPPQPPGPGPDRRGDSRDQRERDRAERDRAERDRAEPDQPEPGQPDSRDPMQEALQSAAAVADETGGLGTPGRPMNRRSPFFVGMTAAAGVAVTYGVVELVAKARSVLFLLGLAFFLAAGLDPVVNWLTRHRVPRWAAVVAVLVGVAGLIAAFLAAAIPPLATQTADLVKQIPHYAHTLQNHNSELGRLNARFHMQQHLTKLITSRGSDLLGGVLGAGKLVLSAASSLVLVSVTTVYFLAGLPGIKLFAYRLVPHSRRPRVILIGDEILAKVGGYVLGNVITSVIAGLGTFLWMLAFGIPYPVLLGLFVAILDLVPVVGSTIGGVVVTLVALTVSLPVAIATLCFYVAYRLAEDYLIVPRIIGRTVQVPAVVSLVAVLLGAVLLGILGALIAIPAAAAIRLLLDEIAFRRLDNS
jgi:predicted PurR-regulated permease PerM